MVLVELQGVAKPIYFHNTWKNNLDVIKGMVKHDRDFLGLWCGRRRSGKSVHCMQALKYLDPSFDNTRICYTPSDFIKIASKLKPYQAIMLDESRKATSGDNAHDPESKKLIDYLNEVGQLNLYIGLVCPEFWDHRSTVAVGLSHCLIHVYEIENPNFNPDEAKSDPLIRGNFDFYGANKKKSLYYMRKKERSFRGFSADFSGDFTNTYIVDEVEYRRLKLENLKRFLEQNAEDDEFKRGARLHMVAILLSELKEDKNYSLKMAVKKYGEYFSEHSLEKHLTVAHKMLKEPVDKFRLPLPLEKLNSKEELRVQS